jgi:DNA primase large subunit
MRRLHETLRTKHHLRHGGRQQYQLFLKEAGMPIEEALKFWRSEFMKVMAPDKVITTAFSLLVFFSRVRKLTINYQINL